MSLILSSDPGQKTVVTGGLRTKCAELLPQAWGIISFTFSKIKDFLQVFESFTCRFSLRGLPPQVFPQGAFLPLLPGAVPTQAARPG